MRTSHVSAPELGPIPPLTDVLLAPVDVQPANQCTPQALIISLDSSTVDQP